MLRNNKLTGKQLLWQAIVFWSVALVAFEAPFSIVFQTKLQNWQVWADVILSSIFLGDLIYNLKSRRLAKVKAKSDFSKSSFYFLIGIDILCAIPFDLISSFLQLETSLALFKLIRLFRVIRIIKLFSMVGNFALVPKGIKIMFGVVGSLILVHWIACGWIMIHPLPDTDRYTTYNMAFYWAVTTLTTIGYGDITPQNNVARLFTMVIMVTGVGVYGVIIGNFSRMLTQADRYKEKSKEKLEDLSAFFKYYRIPPKVQSTIYNYYNHLLTKRLSDNDNKIISELPGPIQNELKTYMNIKLISSVPLFQKCSHSCLKLVASCLEQLHYPPGKSIINIGDVGDEMFIIGHGHVDVIFENGQTVAQLTEGQYFGEIALLQKAKRNASIQAASFCDLYKLSKESFLEIVEKYPSLKTDIEDTIEARKKTPRKSA